MLARAGNAFRALRHRNLRLFFVGQGISLVGTWMQQVAMGWLVYRLTDSELLLGVIAFAGQFPGLLLAPFAGALADRCSRHRMVVAAQTLLMIQASVLAALVVSERVEVWHLVALAMAAGFVNGADIPARQSLLVKLVGGAQDLPNAIALNSSMFNAARLVGPALGGFLVGWVGEGPVFVLNALSYVAVLAALAAIRLPREPSERSGEVLRHIGDGFRYAFGHAPTRDALVVFAGISLVGAPYVVLLPAFARDVLGGMRQPWASSPPRPGSALSAARFGSRRATRSPGSDGSWSAPRARSASRWSRSPLRARPGSRTRSWSRAASG
jgi:MFS family permease